MPWTQRYAPRRLSQVRHQEAVVAALQKYVENLPASAENMPHMLFYGKPGTGKTTCVNLLIDKLYSKEMRKTCVLIMNASDERGIGAVRERIKRFCGVLPPHGAPFKLVVLDECDNMTDNAQFALRRMMEPDVSQGASGKPRFILMCNYLSRIIAPIASRCTQIRFEPVAIYKTVDYLQSIARKESYGNVQKQVLAEVARVTDGDMRAALTLLQSTLRLWGEESTVDQVSELVGNVPLAVVQRLLLSCQTKSIDALYAHVNAIVFREAYCANAILKSLIDVVLDCSRLCESDKAQALQKIAEAEHALKKSANEFLQVLCVAVFLRSLFQK